MSAAVASARAGTPTDAILGAGALGDLGALFPSSDSRWKDADSLTLLQECVARVRQSGFTVVNVDATVVVEAPNAKASPFRKKGLGAGCNKVTAALPPAAN